MKKFLSLWALTLIVTMCACSTDEPYSPDNSSSDDTHTTSSNSSSVTINDDGSTSTGVVFSPIDDTTFFLDYIKYKIVDSHLEIIGCDPVELAEDVVPFASVKYRGATYNTRKIDDGAFRYNDKIKSVNLPEGLEAIGEEAFYVCDRMTAVGFPKSLKRIESRAFSDCTGLTSVSFPEGLKYFGWRAFSRTGLISVKIPKSVDSVEGVIGAFMNCNYLLEFKVAEDNEYFASLDGVLYDKAISILVTYPTGKKGGFEIPNSVTRVSSYAFSGCTGLSSVSFPEGLECIYKGAFSGCTGLSSVSFSEGLECIYDGAFSGCTGLSSVSFPEGLECIYEGAFSGCTGLSSVSFPEGLECIYEGAFSDCTGLTSVSFPDGLKTIESRAFDDCRKLISITSFATTPPATEESSFPYDVYYSATLYVPVASVKQYINASWWFRFRRIEGV